MAEPAVQKALRARYRGAPARGQSDVQRHAHVHKRAPAADVRKPFGLNRAHELAPQRHIEKRPVRADEQHAARRERARPVPHNAQRTPAHEFLVAHANLRARALHKHAKPRRVLRRVRRSAPRGKFHTLSRALRRARPAPRGRFQSLAHALRRVRRTATRGRFQTLSHTFRHTRRTTPSGTRGKFQPHARALSVQRVNAYLAGRIREEPPDQPRPLARRVRRKRNPAVLHLLAQRRPNLAHNRIRLTSVGVRPVLAKAHLAQLHAQRTIRIDRKQPVKIQLVCVFHRNRPSPNRSAPYFSAATSTSTFTVSPVYMRTLTSVVPTDSARTAPVSSTSATAGSVES